MSVRAAAAADVGEVVAIHCDALADDVAPAFGAAFLGRFYRQLLVSPDQTLLVKAGADGVQGFCALALRPPPLRPALRPPDLLTFARHVVRSPRLLGSAFVQARHPSVADWERSAEIAFVAVESGHTGRGFGAELVRRATAEAAARGKEVVVTKTANPRLAAFYQREFAARVVSRFSVAGSTYVVLEWRAPDDR